MATQLSLQLALALAWQQLNVLDLSSVRDVGVRNLDDAWTQGTGLDQADVLWHDRRTLAGAAGEDLDLAGGLNSPLTGQALTFVKLKAILLKNRGTAADAVLRLGGAASHALASPFGAGTDLLRIGPDGLLLLWNPAAAGYAVTAGTADLLRIANEGAAAVDYELLLIGTSA